MKKKHLKLICLLLISCAFAACKKDNKNPDKIEPDKPMVVAVNGKNYTIDKNAIKTTLYSDAGKTASALDVMVPLDNSGRLMKFFIADLKTGTIFLTTKKGTSVWIKKNPGLLAPAALNKATHEVIASTDQSYVHYSFSGNSFYGTDGKINLKYNTTTGEVSYTWAVTFKDANGKEFTTTGGYEFNIKTSAAKPLSAIVDPTPVSAKPTIESITPVAGLQGTQVTVAGINFSNVPADNIIEFNGVKAEVKSATETQLLVIAPVSTTGNISIKVNNSEKSEGPLYTYQAVPTFTLLDPNTGKVGDKITISGTNFSTAMADNEVWFTAEGGATVKAVISQATTTAIKVEVPANSATGPVTVTVKGMPAVGDNNIFTVEKKEEPNALGLKTLFEYKANKYITDIDGNSFVYETLTPNNVVVEQVKKYSKTGKLLKTFTKNDFPGHKGSFSALNFGIDKEANVYVYLVGYEGLTKHSNIFKIQHTTDKITVLRSMANFSDEGFVGSPKLSGTKYFYVDADENIIFMDNNWVNNTAYCVMKINKANVMTTMVDKTKLTIDGNIGDPHGALSPDISFDAAENLYVASISAHKTYGNVFSILKFNRMLEKSIIYQAGLTGGFKQTVIDASWSMHINQMINLDYRLRASKDGKKFYLAQTYGIYKIDTDTKKIELLGNDITEVTDLFNQPLRVSNFFYAENANMLMIFNGSIDGSASKAQTVKF